jgi:hypothetical protein
MTRLAVVVLALASLLAAPAAAWNYTLNVKNDERRVIDLGVFGFNDNGRMDFTVNDLEMPDAAAAAAKGEKIGFTLDMVETATFARQEKNYAKSEGAKQHLCFVDDELVRPKNRFMIPLQDALATGAAAGSKVSFKIEVPGLYALFFYNCKKITKEASPPVKVSFRVSVVQYNLFNGAASFLAVGDTNLPTMYLCFGALFAIGLVAWHKALQAQPTRVFAVHYCMYVLMLLKALSLLLEAAVYHHRKETGALRDSIDYMYYFVNTLKGLLLFTVILLLGSGWSVMKPFLGERDKQVLLAIIPLQVIVNVAMAILEESSEGNAAWARWQELLRIVDVVCCCAILLPVVWSIKTLKDAAGVSGKAQRNLQKLKQFRTFYILVIAFIYFTRIVIALIDNALPFLMTWASRFLYEAAAVLFYSFCGIRFRPIEPESLFAPASDDEDAGEVDLDAIADEAA